METKGENFIVGRPSKRNATFSKAYKFSPLCRQKLVLAQNDSSGREVFFGENLEKIGQNREKRLMVKGKTPNG